MLGGRDEVANPEENAQQYLNALWVIINYQLNQNDQIRPKSPLTRLVHGMRQVDFKFYADLKSEYKFYSKTIADKKKSSIEKLDELVSHAADEKFNDKVKYGGDVHALIKHVDTNIPYDQSDVKKGLDDVLYQINSNAGQYVREIAAMIESIKGVVSPKQFRNDFAPYLNGWDDDGLVMTEKLEIMQNWAKAIMEENERKGRVSPEVKRIHEMIAKTDPLVIYEKSKFKEFCDDGKNIANLAPAPVKAATENPENTQAAASRRGMFGGRVEQSEKPGKTTSLPVPKKPGSF